MPPRRNKPSRRIPPLSTPKLSQARPASRNFGPRGRSNDKARSFRTGNYPHRKHQGRTHRQALIPIRDRSRPRIAARIRSTGPTGKIVPHRCIRTSLSGGLQNRFLRHGIRRQSRNFIRNRMEAPPGNPFMCPLKRLTRGIPLQCSSIKYTANELPSTPEGLRRSLGLRPRLHSVYT